ncbi:ABC transporter permease/substrate-binding protein [Salipaludibacillus sp. CUR1]|uniref:ABC transporter permease/substrate-binding protein n=1 Tax=Salipaludibacillus sp. CUR1 TaxID=2820003 RepID=UPI001E3E8681|nr:ABC transporter permease/substrate-binding protein [Salipaludibacillus sp. CUR1]MCE7792338.1 ABC transporter permease/substrate-binding protein [Salipaludibacillus sp. CUR1]
MIVSGIQPFFQLLEQRQDLLITALWEHVQMSLISLLFAVFIAVPLGILLAHYRKGAEPVIGTTAVLQTIPSLALLGFLIPFLGIGTTPAIVALTAYALMPILRNTYTGLKAVDPALMEASRGMGMGTLQQLHKIQLPLAMPTIMAGIRTGMVLIVGTATLAALIGAGGLGDLIMLGINRSNNYYILLGAIPAAALALLFDAVLRVTEKKSQGSTLMPVFVVIGATLLLVVVPPVLNAVGSGDDEAEEIVIAGKLGAEPEIIINMYKLLIEQDTDLQVTLEPGIGTTDVAFQAVRSGDIDGYFEFTGTAIADLLGETVESNDERAAFEQARDGMYEEFNLVFLEPLGYQNTYAIAVTEDMAEELNLETISDLQEYENDLTAAFTVEFTDRADGYPGIQETYGIDFAEVQTMDPGLRLGALVSGDAEVIDAYSTDAYMREYNLVALEDDENLFPPFNGAPLFREEVIADYPELEEILNQLAGKITEEEMQDMNYQVDEEDANASDVAREYLTDEGLLTE